MLTQNAAAFKEANRDALVESGAWKDKNGRDVTAGPETWVFLRYRLENGRSFDIHEADRLSLIEDGYTPRWVGL